LFLGEWRNKTLESIEIKNDKKTTESIREFIQMNTPVKEIILLTTYFFTYSLKFNTNLIHLSQVKSPWNEYYIQRNKELEVIKRSFQKPIQRMKVLDIHFSFQ
jgi:hypothetical protein